MIMSVTDKKYEKLISEGSALKRIRSTGGGGAGLMAGGITLLVCAVFVGGLFVLMGLGGGGLIFGAIFGVPGILLTVKGKSMKDRKAREYMDYYQKETGFSAEEINGIDREIEQKDVVLVGSVPPGASKNNFQINCIITRNYFVMPLSMGGCYVRRLADIVAATYSSQIPGINGYKQGLVILSSKDDKSYFNAVLTRNECMEVIQAIRERNPRIFLQRMISYEGRQYDLQEDYQEIIQLHKEIFG